MPVGTMPAVESAYYRDPYLKELSTRILRIEEHHLILEDTVFYPTGGGQPGDTGTLTCSGTAWNIINTHRDRETREIRHELETSDAALSVGDEVNITLNWSRRYAHMRMHTCMHLVSALVPVSVTGGGLTDVKGRLDFNITEAMPDKELLTSQLNELISQGIPVSIEMLAESILDEQPELVKTMSVQPPRGVGALRMIRVQDIDFQPCGGTHVKNTAEIGRVRVSKIENKGKQNKRIHIVFE